MALIGSGEGGAPAPQNLAIPGMNLSSNAIKAAQAPPPPPPKPAAPNPPTAVSGPPASPDAYTPASYTFNAAKPDISTILAQDPMYQQLLAFDKAASASDLATMNSRISRMNAYYGSDSDPLSILGRIYDAYQQRNMYIANTLTGHGMINSGETGYQAKRATLDYQRAELDARTKLAEYTDGLQQGYNQAMQQRQLNEINAAGNAVSSWLSLNPPTYTSTPGYTTSGYTPPANATFPAGTPALPAPTPGAVGTVAGMLNNLPASADVWKVLNSAIGSG